MEITFSPWLIWFLAGVGVMLAELAVPGFVIIFFGLGCMGAAAVAAFVPDAYSAQVIVFLLVSILTLLTLRKVAMRIFVGASHGPEKEDVGNIAVGARISIDKDIEPGRVTRVRYRGTLWDAVSQDQIVAGSEAEITGVDKANKSCLLIKSVQV